MQTEKLLIDSHFHSSYLDSEDFGISEGIDIGTRFDDLPQRYEKLSALSNIRLSAAMGPWECGKSYTKADSDDASYGFRTMEEVCNDFLILKQNIEKYKPSFIGECGLDYYWDYGTREMQRTLFKMHLLLAEDLAKPVIIHNRESDSDTINLLKAYAPSKGGIIHCFSGDPNLMECALDRGFYISFAGNLTYKKNTFLRDRLKEVPKDRLLLETDSPYLTPVPLRGQVNTPDKIIHTYNCAAEILGCSVEQLCLQIQNNYKALISR